MALIKCKECDEDVSSKAKTCPKCGAKVVKGTSVVSWLALALVIYIVYAVIERPMPTSGSTVSVASSSSLKSESIKKLPPPKPTWYSYKSKDEMTGKFSAYANSPKVYPNRRMGFPYSDVNSWMGVGCDSDSEWVYFGFNKAPNLTNDETKSGYDLITARVKWDNQVENITLTQRWGEKFIHFRNDSTAIPKISSANTVLLELQWHGQSSVYFEYSLNGSAKAVAEIKAKCAAAR